MNKFTRFALVAATALALTNVAFASSASPKQIAALVNQADQERAAGQSEQANNDLEKARVMTQQVIKEHPGSAKAQYYLAQIDERLGKGEEAQNAIDQTKRLDPNQHFTNNTANVRALQQQVNTENSAAIEKSHTHIFLGVVLVLVLAAVGFFMFNRRRKANAQESDRKKYLTQIVEQNSATMAIDKDLRYQGKEDTVLARDTKELLSAQVEAMTTLQNGSWDGSTHTFDTLSRGFKDINARYQAKNLDDRDNASVSYMDSLKGAHSGGSSYSTSPSRTTYYDNNSNSGYQYQQQGGGTTIINNQPNNNDGFFTGVMMGEMMSRPERETVIVERDRDDSYSRSSSYNDDDDERRRRSSDSSWDSGSSSSSSWDSGSSSSSSFDSGSGSDSSWSDSSFDSGSSSSDSSW